MPRHAEPTDLGDEELVAALGDGGEAEPFAMGLLPAARPGRRRSPRPGPSGSLIWRCPENPTTWKRGISDSGVMLARMCDRPAAVPCQCPRRRRPARPYVPKCAGLACGFAFAICPAMSSPGSRPRGTLRRRAVFLSYAREDSAAAQRIADALRSHGVEAWVDQSELRGGDAWDQKIRRQIKECALFMPIISQGTQARGEGYFRLEWKLAVERTPPDGRGRSLPRPGGVDATPSERGARPGRIPAGAVDPASRRRSRRRSSWRRSSGCWTTPRQFPPRRRPHGSRLRRPAATVAARVDGPSSRPGRGRRGGARRRVFVLRRPRGGVARRLGAGRGRPQVDRRPALREHERGQGRTPSSPTASTRTS